MTLQLYLIRHGETEWSLSGQHTGKTDIPLTARGESEASELALRLQNISFAHVLTSPLQRALKTCELADISQTAKIEEDLVEWDYGDYEGLRSEAILLLQPDWNIFKDGSPNGESPTKASERADHLIARLRTLQGKVALFTHGHFGRVLAMRWIGLPLVAGQHFELGIASLSIFSYDPHHPKVPVIALWNATSPVYFQADTSRAVERWENEGGEIHETTKR